MIAWLAAVGWRFWNHRDASDQREIVDLVNAIEGGQ